MHEEFKNLHPEGSLSKTVVPVDPAVKPFFGIIQVHPFQISESDDTVKFTERMGESCQRRKVIAGRKRVTGIDTHANPRFVIHAVDNVSQVFEFIPQITSLACRIFKNGSHPLGFIKGDVNRFGNPLQALLIRNLSE